MAILAMVAVSETGRRIGQYHHKAKLTDAEVERLIAMHGEGYGYAKLAKMFEISKSQARNIVTGKKRGCTTAKWRTITVG